MVESLKQRQWDSHFISSMFMLFMELFQDIFFQFKYLHFKRLTVKSLYQKRYQRYVFFLHLLHKTHWHLFFRFYQLFYVLKAAYYDSIFLVILSQFLMRCIEGADLSLATINKTIISEQKSVCETMLFFISFITAKTV